MIQKITLITLLSLLSLTSFAQGGMNDSSFDPGTGFDIPVVSIALQSDGKILTGGAFTTFNGTGVSRIARLNADGTLDASFNQGTGFDNNVRTIVIQNDGKILTGGIFLNYSGTARNRIVRLNADGSLDTSFDPGTGFNGEVISIALQSDGKILVVGNFTNYNGITSNRIARLNLNGTLDASFNTGSGFNDEAESLALQSDGKILVAGSFTSYNGVTKNRIVRLNTDGTTDLSFSIGTGFDFIVKSIGLQSDGKIVAVGLFQGFNGTLSRTIARLNSDGTLDLSFDLQEGAGFISPSPYSLVIQSDDKIVVVGDFTGYNIHTRKYIARLNADGTMDASFNPPGTGVSYPIISLAIQADGNFLIGGTFTNINGTSRKFIARLLNCAAPIPNNATLVDITEMCEVSVLTAPIASNNCVGTIIGTHDATLPITTIGTTVVTWTYDDGYGNSSTQTQNIIITPVNSGITQVDGITLTANLTGAIYQWIDCDNGNTPIAGETDQTFTATANGNYAVEVTKNSCTEISNCITVTTVGIEEVQTGNTWKIYPNPATDAVYIDLGKQSNATVDILDINGRIVKKTNIMTQGTIDVSTLTPGTYYLKIQTESNFKIEKLIKQK
jgi:uncharacterized delta-60 repeat protein